MYNKYIYFSSKERIRQSITYRDFNNRIRGFACVDQRFIRNRLDGMFDRLRLHRVPESSLVIFVLLLGQIRILLRRLRQDVTVQLWIDQRQRLPSQYFQQQFKVQSREKIVPVLNVLHRVENVHYRILGDPLQLFLRVQQVFARYSLKEIPTLDEVILQYRLVLADVVVQRVEQPQQANPCPVLGPLGRLVVLLDHPK